MPVSPVSSGDNPGAGGTQLGTVACIESGLWRMATVLAGLAGKEQLLLQCSVAFPESGVTPS